LLIIDIGMSKRPAILTLGFLVIVVSITSAFGARTARKSLLRDGFILWGLDGKLTTQDSNDASQEGSDRWFFEFDSDVTDGKSRLKAAVSVELLPSATLEKMTVDVKGRSDANYRLWARVTKYRGGNFIFPTDFLPLSKTVPPQSSESRKPRKESKPTETPPAKESKAEPAVNEPNDVLSIPQEIREKLKTRKIARTESLEKSLGLKRDSVLAGRVGLIQETSKIRNIKCEFVLDALGRKVPQLSFALLPCEALERAEEQQSSQPDPMRFKTAGIVTEYKGRQYLLLQRATRVYSYENFGI